MYFYFYFFFLIKQYVIESSVSIKFYLIIVIA